MAEPGRGFVIVGKKLKVKPVRCSSEAVGDTGINVALILGKVLLLLWQLQVILPHCLLPKNNRKVFSIDHVLHLSDQDLPSNLEDFFIVQVARSGLDLRGQPVVLSKPKCVHCGETGHLQSSDIAGRQDSLNLGKHLSVVGGAVLVDKKLSVDAAS